jgi:hypothetical protein
MAVSRVASPEIRPGEDGGAGAPAAEERKGPGFALILLIVPVLCCGGPAIFAALAAASAATLGVVGGVIGAALLAFALGLVVRHRRHSSMCCTPVRGAWRS